MIYLSIHGCCMRKITLGSRGPGNSLHCQRPWLKRIINLNLQMELRDLNLSFFMKSFIFSDVSTLLYLLRKCLILTYISFSLWSATRFQVFYIHGREGETKRTWLHRKEFEFSLGLCPLIHWVALWQWTGHFIFLPSFFICTKKQ